MFHVRNLFRIFLGKGGSNFVTFFRVVFPAKLNLSNLSNKNDSRGMRGHMLPRKSFENLRTVMAILVLFEQFSSKFCLYFWPLLLSASPSHDTFCSHSFNHACLRRLRHIVMKRFEIMEKNYSSKALLKMAGGGDASPIAPGAK